MAKFEKFFSDRPVTAFFVLTYLLCWPLLILTLWVFPGNMLIQGPLGTLASFAPAFAAILVARRKQPHRTTPFKRTRWGIFAAAWLLAASTLVLFARYVRHARIQPAIIVFCALLALVPAFVISRGCSPTSGVRNHFVTLIRPRGKLIWYLTALFLVPAVQTLGAGLTHLTGWGDAAPGDTLSVIGPAAVALIFLQGFFFSGGINEESGWRGFALPRLQQRFPPLVAALVVWVFWALWHLPMDLASGDPAGAILMNRIYFNAVWAVLFMWVFNRSRGSVLAPALFHPAMNTSGIMLPRTHSAAVLFGLIVLAVVCIEKMWRPLPQDHPATLGSLTGRE